jgi:hypothetical protein
MIEKPALSDQRIIDCLKSAYDINVEAFVFLPLGADLPCNAKSDPQRSLFT